MITIPEPTQDAIDRRFDLAVKLHKEYLLSKTGKMYPFNPDNLQEAITEMSEEQKTTLAAYAEKDNVDAEFREYFDNVVMDYWINCAEKTSLEVVQQNFDPKNMR